MESINKIPRNPKIEAVWATANEKWNTITSLDSNCIACCDDKIELFRKSIIISFSWHLFETSPRVCMAMKQLTQTDVYFEQTKNPIF